MYLGSFLKFSSPNQSHQLNKVKELAIAMPLAP
jgi:hypothetical protein